MTKTNQNINETLLSRAMEILRYVSDVEHPVSTSEIVDRLKLPKPTAHRICKTLELMGLLARDLHPKRFTVGPCLTALSLATLSTTTRLGPRRAILRQVAQETGETCTLTVMEFDELAFLDRVESASPLRLHLYPGSRAPLHCTSAGKLFLSMLPASRRRTLIKGRPLKRYTNATITDPERLERELDEIRDEQIGRDNQEFIDGLVAIAVPVFDTHHGKMIAGVSLNGPATRLRIDNKERYIHALRQAAEALSQLIVEPARAYEFSSTRRKKSAR